MVPITEAKSDLRYGHSDGVSSTCPSRVLHGPPCMGGMQKPWWCGEMPGKGSAVLRGSVGSRIIRARLGGRFDSQEMTLTAFEKIGHDVVQMME